MFSFVPESQRINVSHVPIELGIDNQFISRDLEEIHSYMSRVHLPHGLTLDGDHDALDFRHKQVSLQTLSLNSTDYGRPGSRVCVDIPPSTKLTLAQISLEGTAEIEQRGQVILLRPGQMCLMDLRREVSIRFDSGYRHFLVKIPTASLSQIIHEMGGVGDALVFTLEPVSLQGQAAGFAQLLWSICADLQSGGISYLHRYVISTTEQMLMRLLLTAVPHNYSSILQKKSGGSIPYYVRRVEGWMRNHASEAVALSDLISVSGVSARSLQAGFRRFYNETPMNYLKNMRLDKAHSLLSNPGRLTNVTDAAFAVGFSHLSKFARDYRVRFREAPSDTLRRGLENISLFVRNPS
ncbi:AraC family transcriptional regulator [Gluconacetobacter sp. Hr-1-5]|uniref:AraC family transcriptional regulator n=1 Tax=Gluconacetobacter sp. Hr-1-5 TaxID=3395370 RepID=UPI003B51D8C6